MIITQMDFSTVTQETDLNLITLIFSKDRVFQLDGTIRSLFRHCLDVEKVQIFILFTASTDQFERQYQKLIEENRVHPNIIFVRQRDFRKDVFSVLSPYQNNSVAGYYLQLLISLKPRLNRVLKYFLPRIDPEKMVFFLVDDNIFVQDFKLSDIKQALIANQDVLGFSLRLGNNTTYSYTLNQEQPLPTFVDYEDNIIKFFWVSGKCDFSYPFEISSSVYRLKQIFPLLTHMFFPNPNYFEGYFSAQSRLFTKSMPALFCFKKSVTFCNPINIVQTVIENRVGNTKGLSATELANMFDQGNRLDVKAYDEFVPNACHQEVDLSFMKV